ncbi:hypothetical protein BC833DRAFT_591079 [Globomyces pollinis-pini]|nr:hypothetical protein BC833DRAFT_591079 [Globomyces pollinis-pini]
MALLRNASILRLESQSNLITIKIKSVSGDDKYQTGKRIHKNNPILLSNKSISITNHTENSKKNTRILSTNSKTESKLLDLSSNQSPLNIPNTLVTPITQTISNNQVVQDSSNDLGELKGLESFTPHTTDNDSELQNHIQSLQNWVDNVVKDSKDSNPIKEQDQTILSILNTLDEWNLNPNDFSLSWSHSESIFNSDDFDVVSLMSDNFIHHHEVEDIPLTEELDDWDVVSF